jgi:3-deoxy-D-manno-octulosonate 8-phosphate phosphatase (KDO 8-P phosphatase)
VSDLRLSESELRERIRSTRLVAFDFEGVFTDNTVYVSEDGSESVRCSRADGIGLENLRRRGIEMVILSREPNPVVSARSKKLGVPCLQSVADKKAALSRLSDELRIPLRHAAFVGNDTPDIACLEAVGLPIVVNDAHPDVLPYAGFRTSALGGRGAVREICDLFERVLSDE